MDEIIRCTTTAGEEIFSWSYGWTLLEDDDPTDNHISLLFRLYPHDEDLDLLGASLSLKFDGLYDDNPHTDLQVAGRWSCKLTLPAEDPGRFFALDAPIEINGQDVTLPSIYLSPITFHFTLVPGEDTLGEAVHTYLNDNWTDLITLAGKDGREIHMEDYIFLLTRSLPGPAGWYCFRPAEILDLAEITSVNLFGQSFSLSQ